jgi:hypothetical protein
MTEDYDLSIHTNPDAMAWAELFMEMWEKHGRPEMDVETMHVWFCNAMMAMHDHMRPDLAPVVMPDGSAFFSANV